jgi:hypothetical protein
MDKEVQDSDSKSKPASDVSDLMKEVGKASYEIVRKRAGIKRQITILLSKLEDATLSSAFVSQQISFIREKLSVIGGFDNDVTEIYDEFELNEKNNQYYERKITEDVDYLFSMDLKLMDLQDPCPSVPSESPTNLISPEQSSLITELGKILQTNRAKVHEIRIQTFSGSQDDVLQFNDFLHQFDDLIGSRDDMYSNSAKLIYLKSYLKGSALDIIKHLSNEDINYPIAIKFLKKEYLDTNTVVDKHLYTITKLTPPSESDFDGLRKFFNTARTSVYELKNFGYNALEPKSLGSKLVSFILWEKLPSNFKSKLSFQLQTDYPSTSDLLDNYSDIIRSLQKTSSKESKALKSQTIQKVNVPFTTGSYQKKFVSQQSPATLQNFQTQNRPDVKPRIKSSSIVNSNKSFNINKPCKLCNENHSMIKCKVFPTSDSRIDRLNQLKLCTACTGKHNESECPAAKTGLSYPCAKCGSPAHITAVCKTSKVDQSHNNLNSLCILTNNSYQEHSNTLIPSVSCIMYGAEDSCALVRCMIDPGSQSSYISEDLRKKLRFPHNLPKKKFNLKTFMGTCQREYEVATCSSHITPLNKVTSQYLVDKNLNLN